MTDDTSAPDLTKGVSLRSFDSSGLMLGRVGEDEVVLARSGDDLFAVGAHCTHYHGPLAEGLIVGDTLRCPWHHACFSLRTGEALHAPALDPIACWRVERQGDTVYVREKLPETAQATGKSTPDRDTPSSVVIVGGGAAGLAAAEMLRRRGYEGRITMLSADDSPPPDRPNLSKDYLAGNAQEDWIPLRPPDYYEQQKIELRLASRVTSLDLKARQVHLDGGEAITFETLLLATGADPVRLTIPGADSPSVLYLRSFADSNAIIEKTKDSKHAVVIGGSFIGLEVSASLRARGIAVDVVAPENVPLERVLGTEVGRFIQRLHEEHGVVFHLGQTVTAIKNRQLTLSGGQTLEADFIVVGIGVRPAVGLAEQAGLTLDRGISVNEYLETSAPGVFAAGDVARWPDPHTNQAIRVEHFVVAERLGQVAARNMLGRKERFDAVPFFWSQHYDIVINYVGHAERWDEVRIDGSLDKHDCSGTYKEGGRTLAVATIGRDRQSLEAEAKMESENASGVSGRPGR